MTSPTNIRTDRPVDTRPCPIYDQLKADIAYEKSGADA